MKNKILAIVTSFATLKWLNPQKDAGIVVRGYIEFTNTRHDELEYRAVK